MIHSHVFPNGLVLVAEPMNWLESAAFSFLAPAGGVHDPLNESGLSSFTCEMMLRGAGSRDSRRFIEDLDNLGVERSEAVTDSHTHFSAAMLEANLSDALSIFSDVLRRPHLPADQLEAARQVAIQEVRAMEDEPAQKVMAEVRRRHYADPWGRPTQGELKALESITIDGVRDHFGKTFRPNGTILGVAGRFEWERLKDDVDRLLGDWPSALEPTIEELPLQRTHQHLPLESSQTQIGIAYDNVPYRHPDYFRAWAGVGALSGGMSSRLFTEVRERRGLCYSVYASCHTLLDRGAVFCYAGTSAERAQETLDVTLGELVRLAEGIQENELDRLRARIKSALIMQQESSSSRSLSVARDWYHLGKARSLHELNGLVDELTCKSINTYLADNPPGDFAVVTIGRGELEVSVGVS